MTLSTRLLAASLLLTCACSTSTSAGQPLSPSPTNGGERIACSFWARTSTGSMSETPAVLEVGDAAESLSLAGFDIEATMIPSGDGGRALRVETMVDDAAVHSLFDFGSQAAPMHLPAGGHGFTGLRYLTSDAGNELQYACGAYAEGVDVKDALASQTAPGPGLGAGDVSCEFVVTEASGAELGREQFTLAPGGTKDVPALGAFSISVRRIEAGPESGGVIVDVGSTVHTLYQLTEPGRPANTMANTMEGPSFTGSQTLEREGQVLRHRCWSDDN